MTLATAEPFALPQPLASAALPEWTPLPAHTFLALPQPPLCSFLAYRPHLFKLQTPGAPGVGEPQGAAATFAYAVALSVLVADLHT